MSQHSETLSSSKSSISYLEAAKRGAVHAEPVKRTANTSVPVDEDAQNLLNEQIFERRHSDKLKEFRAWANKHHLEIERKSQDAELYADSGRWVLTFHDWLIMGDKLVVL